MNFLKIQVIQDKCKPTRVAMRVKVNRTRLCTSRGGHSHTLPIRVCAAQRGRDFEAPDLERGIHFRGVF